MTKNKLKQAEKRLDELTEIALERILEDIEFINYLTDDEADEYLTLLDVVNSDEELED